VNPKSGADRAPTLLPLLNDRLRSIVGELDITMTVDADDAERAAERAVREEYDALYVAGGDGTLNAALRGVVREGSRRIPIGVIPFGTGNDFAKALGLGEQPEPAIEALLEARVVDVDIGMLNDRPFANTSAGGFIADVSATLTEGLKDVTGKLAYLIGGARALFGTEPFSAHLTIADRAPGTPSPASIDVQMFAVCNSGYIGGGYVLAPDAMIDDGLVDVLVVPRMSMLEFVAVLQRLAAGTDVGNQGIQRFQASSFDLEFSRQVRVNTDGEQFETQRCAYRVKRAAAVFFCGPQPHTTVPPRPLARDGDL
jgi:diacylglycerol kinase (ATP)